MTSKRANRYPPELRDRAVRMLLEQRSEYHSEHAAISSIAPKIDCSPDTLRAWLCQHERNNGAGDGGLTSDERQRLKELEQEVRELRSTGRIQDKGDFIILCIETFRFQASIGKQLM